MFAEHACEKENKTIFNVINPMSYEHRVYRKISTGGTSEGEK